MTGGAFLTCHSDNITRRSFYTKCCANNIQCAPFPCYRLFVPMTLSSFSGQTPQLTPMKHPVQNTIILMFCIRNWDEKCWNLTHFKLKHWTQGKPRNLIFILTISVCICVWTGCEHHDYLLAHGLYGGSMIAAPMDYLGGGSMNDALMDYTEWHERCAHGLYGVAWSPRPWTIRRQHDRHNTTTNWKHRELQDTAWAYTN
jgi:hypothetical protein